MYTSKFKILMGLILTALVFSLAACSSGKKVSPESKQVQLVAPALSPAGRLIQFVQTGEPYLLNGVFTESVLERMPMDEMVKTRTDFVRSFGKLLKAEGPNFDSDTTATLILYHEDMTLAANLLFDKQGLIKDLSVRQQINDEQLGSF